MKRILTVGLLLCLLILSASSSTVLLHNQWDDDNDPPETTTDRKKGHIEVVVDRTITDLGSSAKCFVSSTVLIEPAEQGSSFVAFGQVRGIADKNSALNPLYTPPRARWEKVSSTGVPEWISESELDRKRKTKFIRNPPAPNDRLLYSAAKKHSVGWTSDINLGFVKIPTARKKHLRLSESAEITKTKLSGSGMGKAAVIAMFSPYAEAKGRATGAQQSHIPGVHVNTDMPIEDEDDENDNDEMGVASDDSTDGGNESDFISETLTPKCPNCGRVVSTEYEHFMNTSDKVCQLIEEVQTTPSDSGGLTYTMGCSNAYWSCAADAAKHNQFTVCPHEDCNVRKKNCDSQFACANLPHTTGSSDSGSSDSGSSGSRTLNGNTLNSNGWVSCGGCGRGHWQGSSSTRHHSVLTCGRTFNGVTCGSSFRLCSNGPCSVDPRRPWHGNGY